MFRSVWSVFLLFPFFASHGQVERQRITVPVNPNNYSWAYEASLESVRYTPDGKNLLLAYGEHVLIYDAEAGEVVTDILVHQDAVKAVAMDPAGNKIATTSNDGTIRIIDRLGTELNKIGPYEKLDGSDVRFSDDGAQLAAGFGNLVVVIDVQTGKVKHAIKAYSHIYEVYFNPAGDRIVSRGDFASSNLYDLPGDSLVTNGFHISCSHIAFNPSGERYALATKDDDFYMYSSRDGEKILDIDLPESVYSFAWYPSGQFVLAGMENGSVKKLDTETGTVQDSLKVHSEEVINVVFHPSGEWVATGAYDSVVYVLDPTGLEVVWRTPNLGLRIQSIDFSPDGTQMAVSSWDSVVMIFDMESHSMIHKLEIEPEYPEEITDPAEIAWYAILERAESHFDHGRLDSAVWYYTRAYKEGQEIYGQWDEEMQHVVGRLGKIYFDRGEYEKARPMFQYLLVAAEPAKKADYNYCTIAFNMGALEKADGNYEEAIGWFYEATELLIEDLPYNADLMYLISTHVFDALRALGDYATMVSHVQDLITYFNEDSDYLIQTALIGADALQMLGENKAARSTYLMALEWHDDWETATDVSKQIAGGLAKVNASLLRVEEAQYWLSELAGFRLNPQEKAIYHNLKGNLAFASKQYDSAKYHMQKAQLDGASWLGPADLISMQTNLALCHLYLAETDSARIVALSGYRNSLEFGEISPMLVASSAHTLGMIYFANDATDSALHYITIALQHYERSEQVKDNRYVSMAKDHGYLLYQTGKKDLALARYEESSLLLKKSIAKTFTFSNENQRSELVIQMRSHFMDIQAIGLNDPDMNELCLNNHYFFKGIVLNSMSAMLATLANSDDEQVRTNLEAYRRQVALRSRWMSESKTGDVLDSITFEIGMQEEWLAAYYHDSLGQDIRISADWQDVRSQLEDGEVAVEFMKVYRAQRNRWSDTAVYVAYVIRPDMPEPILVNLCLESELERLLKGKAPGRLYASRGLSRDREAEGGVLMDQLYHAVFAPLEPLLKGVHKVYYAPDGMLYQVAFHALLDSGVLLMDRYALHRLSSTSLLHKAAEVLEPNELLIIGGVKYTADRSEAEGPISNAGQTHQEYWSYLPGTEQERRGLAQLLDGRALVQSWSGTAAREEQFKALSGHGPQVIHLATHGFFRPDTDTAALHPLLRSGLLLAGANTAWANGPDPNADEDGILTSLEISSMDLTKTDLVVLSACETGLGEIYEIEGLFGLQRAFKMAGVKMLVLSLWKVPDKETTEFMLDFYRRWSTGIPVQTAFLETQRFMAKKYADLPALWAGFVLMQ